MLQPLCANVLHHAQCVSRRAEGGNGCDAEPAMLCSLCQEEGLTGLWVIARLKMFSYVATMCEVHLACVPLIAVPDVSA